MGYNFRANCYATALAVLRTRAPMGLGLSALIAFAGGCRAHNQDPPKHMECVDTLTGEAFRYSTANVEDESGLFSDAVIITDDDGFKRLIRSTEHLKCREVRRG